MNGQDLLEALSGIDPKYIDEAAFEIKDSSNVVNITSAKSHRNVRKLLYVVLPSVAAILLIVAVALPAVLRVSKSESATMSEAPAAASEAAAPAEDAAMADEAPAMAEAAPEMTEDSDSLDTNGNQTLGHEYSTDIAADAEEKDNDAKRTDRAEETVAEASESAESESAPVWQITESKYENGKLTLTLSGDVPENLLESEYHLIADDTTSAQEDILGAPLSDIAQKDSLKDGTLVLDLSSLGLSKGTYVIDIEGVWTRFEVK